MLYEEEKIVEFFLSANSAPFTAYDENKCGIKKIYNSHVRDELSVLFPCLGKCLDHWHYKGNFTLSWWIFLWANIKQFELHLQMSLFWFLGWWPGKWQWESSEVEEWPGRSICLNAFNGWAVAQREEAASFSSVYWGGKKKNKKIEGCRLLRERERERINP